MSSSTSRAGATARAATTVDLRLQDYRDVDGHFDRIVSIEMSKRSARPIGRPISTGAEPLSPAARAVLQVITIARTASRTIGPADFIQRYIFPGGLLPRRQSSHEAGARGAAAPRSVECFGEPSRTLANGGERFEALAEIAALGFDDDSAGCGSITSAIARRDFDRDDRRRALIALEGWHRWPELSATDRTTARLPLRSWRYWRRIRVHH